MDTALPTSAAALDPRRLLTGLAVGLAAASIGALYTVFARWGIAHGMVSPDLTALRFGTAGVATLPVLWTALRRDAAAVLARWRVWLLISVLAGTPFGLLMFGALQLAPSSHAAVMPFAAMSLAGMGLSAWVLGDALTPRRLLGIAIVLSGLVLLSGVLNTGFSARAALGDLMFVAAGTLWAGFGIVLRRERLDPLLATAVISFTALVSYLPVYLWSGGAARLLATDGAVLGIELVVQGLIAGAGTLYAYGKMVAILGPARAAVIPALAPGLAALMAWPVLRHIPDRPEVAGLLLAVVGLLIAVTEPAKKAQP